MKKLLFLLLALCSTLCARVLDQQGKPLPSLLSLFEALGTPHENTTESLVASAEKNWSQEGERWDFKEQLQGQKENILPHLEKLEYFCPIHAKENHYQYGVVLGSLYASVKRRIAFLVEEWNRGVRFDQVVFLTGRRPLHPTKEAQFLDTMQFETDMMLHTWKETPMPQELRKLPLIVIHAAPEPGDTRPRTRTTVYAWLETHPKPGTCLVVSCQPFVGYQNSILAHLLPTFEIETIGPGGGLSYSLPILLDTVARQLLWEAKAAYKPDRSSGA